MTRRVTVREMAALIAGKPMDAQLYVQLHMPFYACPVNYPLQDVTSEGDLVFLHAGHEHVEGGGTC